jgi:hypothetical protein
MISREVVVKAHVCRVALFNHKRIAWHGALREMPTTLWRQQFAVERVSLSVSSATPPRCLMMCSGAITTADHFHGMTWRC